MEVDQDVARRAASIKPMPKPYSYDLRQKVICAIKLDGLKITQASVIFSISRNTIRLWLKRQRETGDFQALPNLPPGNGHKITDWEKFAAFVAINGDKTQAQMAELWPEECFVNEQYHGH